MTRWQTIAKPVMTVLFGFWIGIALSFIVGPFLVSKKVTENCATGQVQEQKSHYHDGSQFLLNKKAQSFDFGYNKEYEPLLKVAVDLVGPDKGRQTEYMKPVRPRYAATELGIREKLFVGVVCARETVETFGIAINKTLHPHVPKLVYFMNEHKNNLPPGLSVVIFTHEEQTNVPFQMFKYIRDHYVNTYDWYYLTLDTTYTRGENLMNLVNQLSIDDNVYIGSPDDSASCSLDGGVLLSQNVVRKVIDNVESCLSGGTEASRDIGVCIQEASGLRCSENDPSTHRAVFRTHRQRDSLDFMRDIHVLRQVPDFNNVLTVAKVKDDISMFHLHKYFSQVDLNQTLQELDTVRESILESAAKAPQGVAGLTWPLGVEKPVAPKNRFQVTRWTYFTDTHMYMVDDFHNSKPLTGVDKEDVENVIDTCIKRLSEKYGRQYTLTRLVNGYRRFDPVRGMEYILDVIVKSSEQTENVFKRAHLIRPLIDVEFVPMPYVTESSRVNLVLPVTVEEKENAVSFLDQFATVALESGDNSFLHIVLLYDFAHPQNAQTDVFEVIKSMVKFYETKYTTGSKMAWLAFQQDKPDRLQMWDFVTQKMTQGALLFVGDAGIMELSVDLLNRVRMNTIRGSQVFFPIAFWQFKPNLVYEEKPYPTKIDITSKSGFFDVNTDAHASFYNADYQFARRQMIIANKAVHGDNIISTVDLLDLFLKHHPDLHILRAVEPALKHKYRERICSKPASSNTHPGSTTESKAEAAERELCLTSRAESLASKSQLALLVLEQERHLDAEHMDVIHQQQQGAAMAGQIHPNMLKRK